MLDYLADKVDEVAEVEALHVVTNSRFAPDFEAWARGALGAAAVRVHDDGTSSNTDRLGAIGDLRFVIEHAGLDGRGPARRGGRQPVRLLARGVRRLLARAGRQRDRRARRRRPRARAPVRRGRARRRRSRRLARREARAAGQHARRRSPRTSSPPSTRRSSASTWTRATRPTSRAASSSGSTRVLLCTATASRASGSTSATARSCSRPTTACAAGPGLPEHGRVPPDLGTELTQSRHTRVRLSRLASGACGPPARSPASAFAASCAALLPRGLPVRASPACGGSPGRGASAAGRRRPGPSRAVTSVRAGGSRSPPPARRSPTTPARRRSSPRGRSAGCAGSPRTRARSWPRSSRARAHTRSPSSRRTPTGLLKRGHHPAEALARELESHWQLPGCRAARADAARAAAARSRRSPSGVANVRGGFRARERAPSRVVLVDDVYTSGATAAAAASALRRAGARHVDVITFARAVR